MRRIAIMGAPRSWKPWTLLLAVTALLAFGAGPAQGRHREDGAPAAREEQARQAFMVGDYPRALEIYGQLYTESRHPTYLRNIGRCHQMMKAPDQAISVFREYLRIAPDLPAASRAQIEGYIQDMEALQARTRQQAERGRTAIGPARSEAIVTAAEPPASPRRGHGWLWITAGSVLVAAAATALLLLRGSGGGVTCGSAECSLSQVRVETR
jgi:hypothetical protein